MSAGTSALCHNLVGMFAHSVRSGVLSILTGAHCFHVAPSVPTILPAAGCKVNDASSAATSPPGSGTHALRRPPTRNARCAQPFYRYMCAMPVTRLSTCAARGELRLLVPPLGRDLRDEQLDRRAPPSARHWTCQSSGPLHMSHLAPAVEATPPACRQRVLRLRACRRPRGQVVRQHI
jgi:hypothetical protein